MIFLIPARAGSKRLPGKNTRLFCGMPLWMWSWATAHRVSQADDATVVSTDDPNILCHPDEGIWPRLPRLCEDNSPTSDLIHFMFGIYSAHDTICLLQPTSPTRSDSLVRQLIAHGGQVQSVTNGAPNGQCYIYRRGATGWDTIETDPGHDIDTLEDFEAAERDMMRRFA